MLILVLRDVSTEIVAVKGAYPEGLSFTVSVMIENFESGGFKSFFLQLANDKINKIHRVVHFRFFI